MKRIAALFASIALLTAAAGAEARPSVDGMTKAKVEKKKKSKKSSRHRVATDFAGIPQARIRGKSEGLSPLAFARWMSANRRLVSADRASFRYTSSTTKLLNRSANDFAAADVNGDGRISAVELADFVAEVPRYRTFNYRA